MTDHCEHCILGLLTTEELARQAGIQPRGVRKRAHKLGVQGLRPFGWSVFYTAAEAAIIQGGKKL